MSISAAISRIDQILAAEQQLVNPSSSQPAPAASDVSATSSTGSSTGSFTDALAQAQAAGPAGAATDVGAGGAGAATAQKMLALAHSLIGGPYSQANHAGAFTQTVDQIKQLGTDCSGFVSVLLGPQGAGVLTAPQTTDTLPGQPGIESGQGQYVTVWDRPLPGDQGHVIINILDQWFESGGNSTYNPNGGISQMTAAQAQGELGGGGFQPFHPQGL